MNSAKRLVLLLLWILTACTGTQAPADPTPTQQIAETTATQPAQARQQPERTPDQPTVTAIPPTATVTETVTPTLPPPSPTGTPAATATVTVEPTATIGATATVPATPTPVPPAPVAELPAGAPARVHLARLHANQAHPDPARLPHYVISAELSTSQVAGRMRLRLPNHSAEPLNDVVLRLYGNARTIYTGSSMRVSDVRVNGEPVTTQPEVGGTAMRIFLPAPLASGERVDITLTFTTQISTGSIQGYGIQHAARGISVFGSPFPMLALRNGSTWRTPGVPAVGDGASAPVALWDLFIRVPDGKKLVSTGEPVAEEGGRTHIVTGPVRDVALVALPADARPIEKEVAGTRLRYWPAGFVSSSIAAADAATITANAMEAYTAEFGPPPYRRLDVVEAQVPIGGYEYPGLLLFDGPRRSRGDLEGLHFLIPHEVAHQWFYALVGNDVTWEAWIDEGLATYGNLRYTHRVRGADIAARQRAGWEREYATVLARNPVGINRPTAHYGDWVSYRGPTYYAAAIMFDDLRQQLGDGLFREAIQRLIARYAFGEATGAGVRQVFDQVAAENEVDLSGFWPRWFVD